MAFARRYLIVRLALLITVLLVWVSVSVVHADTVAAPSLDDSGWRLSTVDYRVADYASQPFIGNGRIGAMLPAVGQGYQGDLGPTGWPLNTSRYTGSLLAGYYARSGDVESIAALPTWSTLVIDIGGKRWAPGVPAAQVTGWQQTLDLRRAVATTSATWTPEPGKATSLRYEVFVDRADEHVAVVQLNVTPHWSGQLTVIGLLDGRGARRVKAGLVAYNADANMVAVSVHANQTGKVASEASALAGSPDVHVTTKEASGMSQPMTAGERWSFPVIAGRTYQITKYVGIASRDDGTDPLALAKAAALQARKQGWDVLLQRHERDWARLWASDIEITGNPTMQRWVRASVYSLYASVRAGQAWSLAPSGISSDTYAGMIFWDAETWMYPSLLALQPTLALPVLDLRYATLGQARRNAVAVGRKGAVWPWSAGPSMLCGEDDNCKNTQDHLQTDIAFAQWQYYLATGDRKWLRERGWPVIRAVAEFWGARVRRDRRGGYHIDHVIGSDEYAIDISDDAMTNAGVSRILHIATAAAALIGAKADPMWHTIAEKLVIPQDPRRDVHAEFDGYDGRKIKQADVVLMSYPYEYPMSQAMARADLDYYAPRTDPNGPAMTDSVQAIVAMQLRLPGCQAWYYMRRSVEPFIRAPFEQFSESRGDKAGDNAGAPAYVFDTGAGGFLQTILYGLSGLRWRSDRVVFKPMLMPQVATRVTIRGLHYQGRILDLTLGLKHSSITLRGGPSVPVETANGRVVLKPGATYNVNTARPDQQPSSRVLSCAAATK